MPPASLSSSAKGNEDESGHQSLYHQLKQEQRKQRQADEDILLLRNRIAHLKKEYYASEKKIAETRLRSQQIAAQKDGRKLQGDVLKSRKKSVADTQSTDVEIHAKQRADSKQKREAYLKKELLRKQALIQEQQEEKQRVRREKEAMLSKCQKENADKRLERQREVQARKKRIAAQESVKKREAARQKAEEYTRYKELCDHRADEINDLEEMELELINRLKETQARQRTAYETLEMTLSQT